MKKAINKEEFKSELTESFTKTYKEYLQKLDSKALIDIIIGSKDVAPILTRSEPKFSRPQLIWAMLKYNKEALKNPQGFGEIEDSLEAAEAQVEFLIQKLHGKNWNKFYNYGWARFDIRKPGFRYFVAMLILAGIGTWSIIKYIINLF